MRGISFAIVAVGLMLGAAHSQPPPKDAPGSAPKGAPLTIDDLLAQAFQFNPEVLAGEAKIREAEVELRRIKMELAAKISNARNTLRSAQLFLEVGEREFANQVELRKKAATSEHDFRRAEAQLMISKSALMKAEGELDGLTGALVQKLGLAQKLGDGRHAIGVIGGGAGFGAGGGEPDMPMARAPSPAMAEKLRKALDAPIKPVEFTDQPLSDVLKTYRELSGQVPFVIALGGNDPQISLNLGKELPLGATLQAFQDLAPGLQIYVRDYGLFFTYQGGPDDGLPYLEFWQGKLKK